jgi:acyl carrier protein
MRATDWRDRIWQQAVDLLPFPAMPETREVVRPDFGLNALDFVELVLQVEQHFNFRFSAAQLEDLRAVQLVLDNAEPHLRR